MTEQDKEQLNIEISHIFESGANHLRIFEMVENFIDKRYKAINYTHCCTQLLCVSDDFNFVTKGRVYNMEDEPDGHYVIIDDFGEKRLLWKHYFEIVQ